MRLPAVSGLSLERLQSFLLVAEAGGHARAAPGNPGRQSQLSRQVSELETALGQKLFDRAPRGMTLTSAGHALARVVREFGQGLGDVVAVKEGPVRVTLGAGDSVLQWLVLPRLSELRAALDAVQLEVTALGADDVVAGLLSHRLDLGVLRASEHAGELKVTRVGRVSYGVFSAARRARLPLAVATSERALLPALATLGSVALRCETFPQVAQAVRSGEFAGVLPTFARVALPSAGFTMTTTTALEAVATPLSLAWRARTLELRPRAKQVHEALKRLFRAA